MQDSLLRNHVEPWFADWPLGAVTSTDVQAFIEDLQAKGLSAATMRQCSSIAGRVFDSAVSAGLIVRTPFRGTTLPRLPDGEMRFLTHDEVGVLAAAAGDYRSLVLTAAYTGARFGELAALRLTKLDLLRRGMTINSTLSDVGGKVSFKAPKTAASRRRVALPRFLCDVIAEHLSERPAGPEGLIFQAPMGGPLWRSNFRRRVWLPAVNESVGEPMRFHDLRHTHVAMLIAEGEHPKTIQDRLGHASITTTLGTYGHLFDGLDEAAADRLDAAVAHRCRALSAPSTARRRSEDGS